MGGVMDVVVWAAVSLLFCAVLVVIAFGLETSDRGDDAPP
jgi:hypothetical protein